MRKRNSLQSRPVWKPTSKSQPIRTPCMLPMAACGKTAFSCWATSACQSFIKCTARNRQTVAAFTSPCMAAAMPPTELNNQQWRNQIMLYTPAEGVYVAPRAPFDDWNMWFRPEMNDFFRMLIAAAVVEMEVNPDKVYLLGYSAGGDGVWRMAPRMADRWAAASMMAGHPGEASQVNLLNLPFMIWMGEHDAAYNRNALAVEKGQVLDSLHAANPSGYIHETHIVSGKGHWMDRADTAAIAWMAQYRRNPYPAEVVWRQEDVVSPALYWLQVPEEEARPGMLLHVRREGNRIFIDHSDYAHVTLLLNDDMLDLDRPLTVEYKGKTLFRGKVRRSADVISRTLAERQDPCLIFSAELPLTLP